MIDIHPVDIYVGERLKHRRDALGLSQVDIARKIGISFQQLQKYERAVNRISASRLYDISLILDVDPSYFFEGYEDRTMQNRVPDFLV